MFQSDVQKQKPGLTTPLCLSRYEDLRAVDGGKHGLDVIEPLLMFASKCLKPNSCMFLEVDPCHAYLVPQMITELNAQKMSLSRIIKDFCGIDRFLVLCKK